VGLEGRNIGFAMTGSYCTFQDVLPEMRRLAAAQANVMPILSEAAASTDTRFYKAVELQQEIFAICGRRPLTTIVEVEPIGPKKLLDVLIVAPCTGNTLAKVANGITDTAVTMAVKAHLRNQRPVVLAISTNDALGINAKNIGYLLNVPHIYMVPFGQDNPEGKSNSIVADMTMIAPAIEYALQGKQVQPVIIHRSKRAVI